jgi:lycopene cyclase CruA
MQEILYLEIPTPDLEAVKTWLQQTFQPEKGNKQSTASGCCLDIPGQSGKLSIFVWSLQRTTYLKMFRWGQSAVAGENAIARQLRNELAKVFPHRPPQPPAIDLSQQSIFAALEQEYPLTVKFFQQMPQGEADLRRVYWWERLWWERVRHPQQPQPVISKQASSEHSASTPAPAVTRIYDLIYVGGALGVLHAAMMARMGYRVLLLERLPFGRMNREWNISRNEFQSLLDLGLFTTAEFESFIAREYKDGFNKFFDANNPAHCQAEVLHTPTVLNVALDSSKFLQLCAQKLRQAGGEIWDETEFVKAEVGAEQVWVSATHLPSGEARVIQGRLLVDAMGSASPIAWQLNGGRAFESVCPTVGAIVKGYDPTVWDANYGDVLNSHGDISRGRQLIWELFPGPGDELTIYLFHYHQPHPDNPGSLLEMYEDFFTILPEYRRCDLEQLTWVKPTFGYIPGHYSLDSRDRRIAFDRLVAIGDAASLQSPLVFTGFGSLVRNLPRLTDLLDTALKHDLLKASNLEQVRAYQSNIAVTWLFSRGMMVPTGRQLPPTRINAMLNTFFSILAAEPTAQAEAFIKDRAGWLPFNRMAVTAALKNPMLIYWIWDLVEPMAMLRWLGSYFSFTWDAFLSACLGGWFPKLVRRSQPWLEEVNPNLWFWLLVRSYALTYTMGQARIERKLEPDAPTPSLTSIV